MNLNTAREKKTTQEIVLGQALLERRGDEAGGEVWEYVAATISYSVPVSQYWGHIPGTVIGLPAEVRRRQQGTTQLTWGMEWKGEAQEDRKVGVFLQPGTAVNVTLKVEFF